MARPKSIISKSQLAKELGLSKSRISQLSSRGLPVRKDGQLNRDEAAAWYRANIREQVAKPVPKRELPLAPTDSTSAPASVVSTDRCEVEEESEAYRGGIVDTLFLIACSDSTLEFARRAIKMGCTPKQAYGVAWLFGLMPSEIMTEVEDLAGEELPRDDLKNPTEAEWRTVLGEDFDFAAANSEFDEFWFADPKRGVSQSFEVEAATGGNNSE